MIAIYSVIVVPVRIGINKRMFDPYYNWVDGVTWLLYVLDVIINFRTTYIDNFGEEIYDKKKITLHYVTTYGFWVDLISLIAFPGLEQQPFNYCGLLKVNRIFRLLDLIAQSNIEKGPKALLQFMFYGWILFIYLHITGCLWFTVIKSTYDISADNWNYLSEQCLIPNNPRFFDPDDDLVLRCQLEDDWSLVTNDDAPKIVAWVPPYDYFDGSESFWSKVENKDVTFVYTVCLYYSVLVVGGNELGPKETVELVYIVAINLIGAIVNAYIFGELAVLIAQFDRKAGRYQHVFDTANTAMTNIGLPDDLKEDIRTYFKKV